MLTLDGENGSARSRSGLVALPSNEVGRVVKVVEDDRDESERNEHSDSDRCMSHTDRLYSVRVAFVCAGGVLGGCSRYGGNRRRSLGEGSVWLCVNRGLPKVLGTSTDGKGMSYEIGSEGMSASGCTEMALDGTGISDANSVDGNALLRVWKL
jgi:hypothetical protein